MSSVELLPDDLPPEWLGIFTGFAFERKGLLSVREGKRLRKAAAAVLEHWQMSRFRSRELNGDQGNRIISRLSKIRRPLQARSLYDYLAKAPWRQGRCQRDETLLIAAYWATGT